LIRDVEDFGVIVIGDPRLTAKAYGRVFLESLPPSPVLRDVEPAAKFLREQLERCRPVASEAR
jgi:ATP-dependent DNA helicase DinG